MAVHTEPNKPQTTKVMSKNIYLANKQKSGLLGYRFLEERARQLAESGSSMDEKKLNQLILTVKTKERSRILRTLKPIGRGTGLRILDIQNE